MTETKPKTEVVKKEVKAVVPFLKEKVNPRIVRDTRRANACVNILKESGVPSDNPFYNYLLVNKGKEILIEKATRDYQ